MHSFFLKITAMMLMLIFLLSLLLKALGFGCSKPPKPIEPTEPTTEITTQVSEPSTTQPVTEESSSVVTEPSATEPSTEEPSSVVTEPSATEPSTEEPSSVVTKPATTEPTTKIEIGPQIRTVNQSFFAPFGGTGNDIFTDVDNTSDGGFVACGKSTSTDQDLQGVPQSSWSNYSFVVKFDKDGNVVWKKAAGSSDRAYELKGIAVLNDGSIVTVGYINSSETDPLNKTIAALMLKYSADGNLIFEKRFDGKKSDIFSCVCATNNGFAVGGKTESTDGDFSFIKLLGNESPFVISFDSAANPIWQTSVPGNNGGSLVKIASDQYGNIFSTILTTSTTGSYAAFEGLGKGYADTVVLKHDSSGNYIWNYVIASSARDEFGAIAADNKGGCTVAGNYELIGTYSPDGTLAGLHNCGGIDSVVMHIDSTGKRTWAKVIGGYGNDYINDITAVADGGYAVAGYTTSSDRDFAKFEYGGENDAFIAFITPGGNMVDIKAQGGSKNDMLNCVAYSPLGGVMALGQTTSKDGTFNGMNSHLNDIYIIIFGFLPFTGYLVKYRVSISKY